MHRNDDSAPGATASDRLRPKTSRLPWLCLILLVVLVTPELFADEPPAPPAAEPVAQSAVSTEAPTDDESASSRRFPRRVFSGQVVELRDALRRREVTAFDEFEGQVVLETSTDELIPIVPDWRGRALYQDKRLRNRPIELVGYRRPGVPYLQVLMVFTFDDKGERQYTDYWCDICSIPMYEIKACDCCQGDIRLRFQPQDLPDYVTGTKDQADSADDQQPASQEPNGATESTQP